VVGFYSGVDTWIIFKDLTNHVSSRHAVEKLLAKKVRTLRNPNLNALRMFDAAARHLNFRIAADEMNLTQGAVAQQVRQLETDLGIQLFHRKTRGLALTEPGRPYHSSVRKALKVIDDATKKLKAQSASITLSVTPSFASKWLVPRLTNFTKTHPDINVQTVASEGVADFKTDSVDIAIRQGHPPFGDGLRVECLSLLDLCAVCSPSYAKKSIPTRQFEDFKRHLLIQDSHKHWDDLFENAGITPQHRIMQFNQTALAMDAAANGQGVALAPRILVSAELGRGKLIELWHDNRTNQNGFYVVCPNLSKLNAEIDTVIEWVLSEAKRPISKPSNPD
jgi:LysR family transcriptional regulator, glycine cleavage system transcriptional activator